jgi:hypothetical protein
VQDAVKACNVFYHLTYEGSVDLEELRRTNEALYSQYLVQIAEFGQVPSQLFTRPHPVRELLDRIPKEAPSKASAAKDLKASTGNGGAMSSPRTSKGIGSEHKEHIIEWPIASVVKGIDTIPHEKLRPRQPTRVICREGFQISTSPLLLFAVVSTGKLFTVDASRLVRKHDLVINPADMKPPYILKVDRAVEASKYRLVMCRFA